MSEFSATDFDSPIPGVLRQQVLSLGTAEQSLTVHVGFSGGRDSTVLLQALVALRDEFPRLNLSAIHINHQLHDAAAAWSAHCEAQAELLGVPLQIAAVSVDHASGRGPEAAARDARYAVFRELLCAGGWLALAHHQEDQAETLFLQLMRGTGAAGLAGMPVQRDFSGGHLWRPLLEVSKPDIAAYADHYGLQWIEDPSNADTGFDRNFLRNEILPRTRERWPGADAAVGRAARHSAAAAHLLDELAQLDAERFVEGDRLATRIFTELGSERQKNVLRFFIKNNGLSIPSEKKLNDVIRVFNSGRADAAPVVDWGAARLRRYREHIIISADDTAAAGGDLIQFDWLAQEPLVLGKGLGRLIAEPCTGQGLREPL
ncbi:MAG: tRNA lysidine(34) synthetase TilS, partial [Gammaproteobacteria bacterium]